MVKESIIPFKSFKEVSFNFFLSPEVVIIEIRLLNEALKPLSITLFLLKFSSNDDEISIFDTLNVLASKKLVEKIIINRTYEKKNIYSFFNLIILFIICIFYTNEKSSVNREVRINKSLTIKSNILKKFISLRGEKIWEDYLNFKTLRIPLFNKEFTANNLIDITIIIFMLKLFLRNKYKLIK